MKMKFPGRMRPPAWGVGPPVKVILKSLSLAEVCTSRWQEHFSLSLLIFPCLPRILPLPLGFSFARCSSFFFFHSHAFSLSVATTSRKISLTFSRIAGSSLAYRMSNARLRWKSRVFGFTFRLMDLIRRQTDESKENRRMILSFLLGENKADQQKKN